MMIKQRIQKGAISFSSAEHQAENNVLGPLELFHEQQDFCLLCSTFYPPAVIAFQIFQKPRN